MGKVRYMSPEQATFQKTDASSDLFSLGIVAYELLSGQVIFGAETTEDVLKAVDDADRQAAARGPPRRPGRGLPHPRPGARARPGEALPGRGTAWRCDLEHFIYHDRFGPTVVTLEKYLAFLFPDRFQWG